MQLAFVLLLAGLGLTSASGQQFDLGLLGDPCTGGIAYVIPAAPPGIDTTLRYSTTSFTCTFPAPTINSTLTLNFIEPTVMTAGQRLFSVAINGTVVLDQFDVFKQCGYRVRCSRTAPIAAGALVKVLFTTEPRSACTNCGSGGAMISSVSIPPPPPPPVYSFDFGLTVTTIPDPDGGPSTIHVRIDDTVVPVIALGTTVATITAPSGDTCNVVKLPGTMIRGFTACQAAGSKSSVQPAMFQSTGDAAPAPIVFGIGTMSCLGMLNSTASAVAAGAIGPPALLLLQFGPVPANGIAWQCSDGASVLSQGSVQWP